MLGVTILDFWVFLVGVGVVGRMTTRCVWVSRDGFRDVQVDFSVIVLMVFAFLYTLETLLWLSVRCQDWDSCYV